MILEELGITGRELNILDDRDEFHYGLKGSPTQVERMFNPDRNTNKVVLKGTNDELVEQLLNSLKESKYL